MRWVAARHADNHVHVVATLARQDGRRVWPRNDFYQAREAGLAVEDRYGLTRVGVLVRPRMSTLDPGQVTGYAVALRAAGVELDRAERQALWQAAGKAIGRAEEQLRAAAVGAGDG